MTEADFKQKVADLNGLILRGQTFEALEQFYADDVEVQENDTPPRTGKAVNLAQEKQNLDGMTDMTARLLNQAIDCENHVVLSEWLFVFTNKKNQTFRLQEVSVQQWRNGLVWKEKFYYAKYVQTN